MPVISDARRAERRAQILAAAWRCFQRDGLHRTTMDDIVRASGLSAGAVYGYFGSKEVLIQAALATSMGGLGEVLEPLFAAEPPLAPAVLAGRIAAAIEGFSMGEGYDPSRLALLGWSEAQRDPALRRTMQGFYTGFLDRLGRIARHWRDACGITAEADPDAVARTLLSLFMGYIAQGAVLGAFPAETLAAGLRGLGQGSTDGHGGAPGPAVDSRGHAA